MEYTIKDVARIAGVSVATASMAVNGKPGPKEETRKKVLDVAAKLKYTPNASARTLIKKRSESIGLIVTDITNPFFGMLVNEINKEVVKYGYTLSLALSCDSPEHEIRAVKKFMEDRVEGVIIVPSALYNSDNLHHIKLLSDANIPFVFSTSAYKEIDAACIMCDLEKGAYMVTEHLLNTGHRKIVMLSGASNTLFSSNRIEGCKKAHSDKGLIFDDSMIFESYPDYMGGYNAANLCLSVSPDAIIAINDQMAMGVIRYLKEHNYSVGNNISVAGFDDLLYSSLLETPLTTVRQPLSELASKTVSILIKGIQNGYINKQYYYIDPILKIRNTTNNYKNKGEKYETF